MQLDEAFLPPTKAPEEEAEDGGEEEEEEEEEISDIIEVDRASLSNIKIISRTGTQVCSVFYSIQVWFDAISSCN